MRQREAEARGARAESSSSSSQNQNQQSRMMIKREAYHVDVHVVAFFLPMFTWWRTCVAASLLLFVGWSERQRHATTRSDRRLTSRKEHFLMLRAQQQFSASSSGSSPSGASVTGSDTFSSLEPESGTTASFYELAVVAADTTARHRATSSTSAHTCSQFEINSAASKLAQFPVLITGTSRSGTHFISSLFLNYDFDLPHEMLGEDGSVSWM